MYSLLLLLHHFGEDGILELLHLQPPTSTVQVVVGHIYFRCKSKMYSLLLLLHHFGEDGILELLHLQPPTSTVLSTVNLLENFGAQRANHVYSTAFSSPRSLALSAKLLSTARQLSARQLSF